MSLNLLVPVLPPYSIIVEADWEGKIVNSWHSNSADQRLFSDAKIVVSILLTRNVLHP
jgi:hypothetical protein